MDKKRLAINMSAQLLVFIINLGISFVLTAVIDSSIDDAYGFTKTANDIVTWAQIVVSALNTMASRFITIQLHKKDHQGANEYFSSVFYANLMMAGIFLVPAICVVMFLNHLGLCVSEFFCQYHYLGLWRDHLQLKQAGAHVPGNHCVGAGAGIHSFCHLPFFSGPSVVCGTGKRGGYGGCGLCQQAVYQTASAPDSHWI